MRAVGDATREQASQQLLSHVVFRHPTSAADLKDNHGPNEIGLLFIDADHGHPWPTLDLYAALPFLAPRATVIVHDINLPLLHPQSQDWGAKYLFDGLTVPKAVPAGSDHSTPNIGSFAIPEGKEIIRDQLRDILQAHEWQVPVSDQYLRRVGRDVEGRVVQANLGSREELGSPRSVKNGLILTAAPASSGSRP
jgi:hypothetical protein